MCFVVRRFVGLRDCVLVLLLVCVFPLSVRSFVCLVVGLFV